MQPYWLLHPGRVSDLTWQGNSNNTDVQTVTLYMSGVWWKNPYYLSAVVFLCPLSSIDIILISARLSTIKPGWLNFINISATTYHPNTASDNRYFCGKLCTCRCVATCKMSTWPLKLKNVKCNSQKWSYKIICVCASISFTCINFIISVSQIRV